MTFPRDERDLLMACASFRRSSVAPDLSTLSDPAKSTKVSLPYDLSEVKLLVQVTPTISKLEV